MTDEEMDELQEELSNDFDAGYAIKEQVIPRAVEWFTGEIAPPLEEFDEDEFEDYMDEEPEPAPRAGKPSRF